MSILLFLLVCLGVFVVVAAIIGVSACMLSSQISQDEERQKR